MHKLMLVVIGIGACATLAGGSFGAKEADPLVVHEWGTFTSLQGSDGVTLEGLEREEEALPRFVYDRTKVRDCPLRRVGYKGLEQPIEGVTQKMETPVIYFHTRSAKRVRVRVDFEQGLISQWYPVSDLLGPPEGSAGDGPLDLAKVPRSFLEWEVDLLPLGEEAPPQLPEVAGSDDPWLFARDVNACWLRTAPRRAPDRQGPIEAERFLFYRGLGRFALPIEVRAERGGRGRIQNRSEFPLADVVVLEVAGERGRLQLLDAVAARGEAEFAHGGDEYWGPIREVGAKLEALLAETLCTRGLNPDEAKAMVRTWSRSWFRSEGTRVLYIVPRPIVDRMLPLRITPEPEALVRVLLGRLEYLTPEVEDEVEGALVARAGGDEEARRAADARLARLGRFLEPHLRRTMERTQRAEVRAVAQAMLADLERAESR